MFGREKPHKSAAVLLNCFFNCYDPPPCLFYKTFHFPLLLQFNRCLVQEKEKEMRQRWRRTEAKSWVEAGQRETETLFEQCSDLTFAGFNAWQRLILGSKGGPVGLRRKAMLLLEAQRKRPVLWLFYFLIRLEEIRFPHVEGQQQREKSAERTCSSGVSLGIRLAAQEARMTPVCFLFEGCRTNRQRESLKTSDAVLTRGQHHSEASLLL